MDESDLPLIIPSAEKPRLSEVIDYECEIAPYSLTMIYAGLGSGKNTFAGYLMNGSPKYNLPKLTVLLITSRKAMLLDMATAGDTIITLEVSRLSRSTQQMCEIIDIIREKKLRLVIVGSITIDCRNGQTDPMSEAFLQMAGVFSQLELAMIRARVKSGMENAKSKGKRIGRPQTTKEGIPTVFTSTIRRLWQGR